MRRAVAVAAVAVWLLAILGVYRWSVSGSGWAIVNTGITAIFGLAALVPTLRWLSRRDVD